MKLTKSKLKQIIKEELGGLREVENVVYVVRSEIIDAETGKKSWDGTRHIVGIFTDKREADALQKKLGFASVNEYELNTFIRHEEDESMPHDPDSAFSDDYDPSDY